MVNGGAKDEPAAREDRHLEYAGVLQPLLGTRVGHQLLRERRGRVVQVVDGVEGAVGGGADEGDALASGTPELEAVGGGWAAAKRCGEGVELG